MQAAQAKTLIPVGSRKLWRLGYFLVLTVGLYLPRSFFLAPRTMEPLPQMAHCLMFFLKLKSFGKPFISSKTYTIMAGMSKVSEFFYKKILRRILFLRDPEKTHDFILSRGAFLGRSPVGQKFVSFLLNYENPALEQNIFGIRFKNPVGLAAGFDKNAQLTQIIGDVGFGFTEIGSVTARPCAGNPKPRLWRLKKSKGIIVNYGLKNDGAKIIYDRLKNLKFNLPIGVSIARTNSPEVVGLEKEIADYAESFKIFENLGDYFALNISCPNTCGGMSFAEPANFEKLLRELNKIEIKKPIFVKFPPDISLAAADKILDLCRNFSIIKGFIISNLTKNREIVKANREELEKIDKGVGGISGKAMEELSNNLISYVYKQTGGDYVIIGCGGIFSAEDAYKKIKLGANLVQLITGMIFEGPQLIGQINKGLVKLLKKDGFKNISEAVGKSNIPKEVLPERAKAFL